MRAVVSDTSVLNYLALLGSFDLLRDQFGQMIVPEAVLAELEVRPDLPGAALVRQGTAEGWIEVAEPRDAAIVRLLREDLGLGESQAIALAVERSADSLLTYTVSDSVQNSSPRCSTLQAKRRWVKGDLEADGSVPV